MEGVFRNTSLVTLSLVVGALVMFVAEYFYKNGLSCLKKPLSFLRSPLSFLRRQESPIKTESVETLDSCLRRNDNSGVCEDCDREDDNNNKNLSLKKGFIIGCFQALALVPGFSRSGMTISGGLLAGLRREAATRFSFLLAFPILVGSGAKKIIDLLQEGISVSASLSLFTGAIVSFVVGIIAIHFLLSYLKKNTLYVFVWYRLILAVVILLVL
jgi:undecaprenyl pyrophosphate phosphatase UppP